MNSFSPSRLRCALSVDCEARAGKTTVLRNLLSQGEYKIGCVVNDVAAVNIDAKLIRNQTGSADDKTTTSDLAPTIELQNGCACAIPPFRCSAHHIGHLALCILDHTCRSWLLRLRAAVPAQHDLT